MKPGQPDPSIYETRNNALTSPASWALNPTGLSLQNGAGTSNIPWQEVREIRLRFAPTRYVANRYTCELALRSGGTVWFSSHFYRGFMQFEDRLAQYSAFVRQLIDQATLANRNCKIVVGANPLLYIACVLSMIFATGMFFISAKLILAMGATWAIGIKLLVAIYLYPRAIRWIQVNRRKVVMSDEVPEGVLPR